MSAKRVAWITDPHLDFLHGKAVREFCRSIADTQPDVVLVGGDIGNALSLGPYLDLLEDQLRRPIYFILGNHDFYGSSIARVCELAAEYSRTSPWLHWLPDCGVVALTERTGLIGHDGWADGRLGLGSQSTMLLNDYVLIEDLAGLDAEARFAQLHALGDEAAGYLRGALEQALDRFEHVLLLTHVPPFREACLYNGAISDDEALPHFCCKALGDMLLDAVPRHPDHRVTALAGHTHGLADLEVLPNLRVRVGGAEYGRPAVQDVLLID